MEEQRLTIKAWAEEDRPREKLLTKGRSVLSDAELIAILIGSGNRDQTAVELSQHILKAHGNNINDLAKCSVNDLQKFKGIGEAKAISIVSALELGRRRGEIPTNKKFKILSSKSAYELMKADLLDLAHEEFWVVFLQRNNVVIKKSMVSKGGVSQTIVDPKIIFKSALEESASGIIVCHNHPSGNLQPSKHDIQITQKIKKAGESLEIKLLDHIIIASDSFFSFADENLL